MDQESPGAPNAVGEFLCPSDFLLSKGGIPSFTDFTEASHRAFVDVRAFEQETWAVQGGRIVLISSNSFTPSHAEKYLVHMEQHSDVLKSGWDKFIASLREIGGEELSDQHVIYSERFLSTATSMQWIKRTPLYQALLDKMMFSGTLGMKIASQA